MFMRKNRVQVCARKSADLANQFVRAAPCLRPCFAKNNMPNQQLWEGFVTPKLLFFGILLLFAVGGVCNPKSSAFLCGTPYLRFPKAHPQAAIENQNMLKWPAIQTAPAAAPALPVGTERTFFAPDFRSQQQYTVSAVLRGVGSFCYVFVEESEWNTRVTPRTVETIIRAFEHQTPANPQQGIYPTLTELFGPAPDIDENGRVILLLLNIRDLEQGRAGFQYTAGFFNPADQHRGVLRHPGFRGFPIRSNESDMLYIDTQPLNPNSEAAHNVIAHEFQHLIHWRHDAREATWVDEGCAEYAAFLCGYTLQEHLAAFEKMPSVSLIEWPVGNAGSLAHYGAVFLWMLYLHERYGGAETLAAIVHNRGTSLIGVTDALRGRGAVFQQIAEIFIDWKIANYLSDYHHVSLNLSPTRRHSVYPSTGENSELSNFSADYLVFENAEGLTLGFSSSTASGCAVHAIEFHSNGEAVQVREMMLTNRRTGSLAIPNTVTKAILVPSFHQKTASTDSRSVTYEYSATRSGSVTFVSSVLPNPVHPQYWDIITQPSEPLVGITPTVTLLQHNRIHREAQAMYPIQDGRLYRFSFHLEPDIAPASVTWQIFLDSLPVDTGTLK